MKMKQILQRYALLTVLFFVTVEISLETCDRERRSSWRRASELSISASEARSS